MRQPTQTICGFCPAKCEKGRCDRAANLHIKRRRRTSCPRLRWSPSRAHPGCSRVKHAAERRCCQPRADKPPDAARKAIDVVDTLEIKRRPGTSVAPMAELAADANAARTGCVRKVFRTTEFVTLGCPCLRHASALHIHCASDQSTSSNSSVCIRTRSASVGHPASREAVGRSGRCAWASGVTGEAAQSTRPWASKRTKL